MLSSVISDAQTAITSLGGVIGGVASDSLSDMLLRNAGLGAATGGLGDVGLRFVVRASVTSLIFAGAAYVMPETADNVFFSIVFFAGNRKLVADAVRFGTIIVDGTGFVATGPPPGITPPSTAAASSSCSCK